MSHSKATFELVAGGIARHNDNYALDALAVWYAAQFKQASRNFDKKKFLMSCLCSELTILAQTS